MSFSMRIIKDFVNGKEPRNHPLSTGEAYIAEVMGEIDQAHRAVRTFVDLVNEFQLKALRLIRDDLNGHKLYIQDIVEVDDVAEKIPTEARFDNFMIKFISFFFSKVGTLNNGQSIFELSRPNKGALTTPLFAIYRVASTKGFCKIYQENTHFLGTLYDSNLASYCTER